MIIIDIIIMTKREVDEDWVGSTGSGLVSKYKLKLNGTLGQPAQSHSIKKIMKT